MRAVGLSRKKRSRIVKVVRVYQMVFQEYWADFLACGWSHVADGPAHNSERAARMVIWLRVVEPVRR